MTTTPTGLVERLMADLRAKDSMAPATVADLLNRLRGQYRIPITDGLGPAGGEEPDNPLEHVRTFPGTPAIQLDAAYVIEGLLLALSRSQDVEGMARLIDPLAFAMIGDGFSEAQGYGQDAARSRAADIASFIQGGENG